MVEVANARTKGLALFRKDMESLEGEFSYGETAYHLPVCYALTGKKVSNADSAREVYRETGESVFVAGECTVAASVAAKGGFPPPFTGFIGDAVIRKLGYSLVDGSIAGLALVTGTPAVPDHVVAICRELQEKLMLTFLSGDVVPALVDAGVKVGVEFRLVPLGPGPIHAVHLTDLLARVAMMFGGVAPGDADRLVRYANDRTKVFAAVFPGLSDREVAYIDALRSLGVSLVAVGDYEGDGWAPAEPSRAVATGMAERGISVAVTAIPIPMHCSPAFEGKSIRKEEMYVEFGGGRSPAFELLVMRDEGQVVDGKVTLIGPDVDQLQEGSAVPLGIIVEVAGKQMRKEYEPVLERRIHNFINYGEGSWHVAQRDLIWVRLSKEAVKNGVKIRDLGVLLAAKFRMDFPTIIDAVQVTLITDRERVLAGKQKAELVYAERDSRIAGMKDSDVDTFYSCTLCQTFAPNHVCIITPERPALCGAISWLDGKVAHEISPAGANQPVPKGSAIDDLRGEFEGVNSFVRKASHGEVARCCLYSIMESPMTCCGCFECIALVVPEANGVLVVNREYQGETPVGMTFSTLAGTIGGGAQTPGFIGISKNFILSERFLQAEGGISRLVWLPSLLREELGDRLREALAARGLPGLYEKIADETRATTLEELVAFLSSVDHPALTMPPLL